jgi:hypothetical protein
MTITMTKNVEAKTPNIMESGVYDLLHKYLTMFAR